MNILKTFSTKNLRLNKIPSFRNLAICLCLALLLATNISPISAKLDTKINLSFEKSKLSSVLMALAKIAEVNLVLPTNLDDQMSSVSFEEIQVIEAIKNVLEMHGLKHVFLENTIRVINEDIDSSSFEVVKLKFTRAGKLTKVLNEKFFSGLKLISKDEAPKPYALSLDEKNSLLIFGNADQIKLAKNFISSYDTEPEVKLFPLSYIETEKSLEFLRNLHPYCQAEEYRGTRAGKDTLLLKGSREDIEQAEKILSHIDRPSSKLPHRTLVYIVKNDYLKNSPGMRNMLNENFPEEDFNNLKKEFLRSPDFRVMESRLVKVGELPLKLESDAWTYYGLKNLYQISFFDYISDFQRKGQLSALRLRLNKDIIKQSKALKSLKKVHKLSKSDELLVFFETL